MAADGQTITYRGRSLEEVLPKIREELGPDAIIERQRTGLVGGVGGFFQREMVEVDARPATAGETGRGAGLDVLAGADDEPALRAATAPPDPDRDEGLHAPAMRRIVEGSAPFANLLAGAERETPPPAPADDDGDTDEDPWDAWDADDRAQAASAGPVSAPPPPATPARFTPRDAPPQDLAPSRRPAAADAHVAALAERGLSPGLAEAIVAEAVSHAMPFAGSPRGGLKRQVRATLARRIPILAGFGGAGRTIALVGAAGAGKTRAAAGLAAAYAAGSDLPVVCLAMRPRDVGAELGELLDPHGVTVRPVDDGASARAHIGTRAGHALVVLDTPAVSPRDDAAIARLAGDLRAAGVTETHVVLPATVAAPVARAVLRAFGELDPAAILLTHVDETDHLGPLVDVAVAERRPLSYVASGPQVGADLQPADPAALAARLLP